MDAKGHFIAEPGLGDEALNGAQEAAFPAEIDQPEFKDALGAEHGRSRPVGLEARLAAPVTGEVY